MQLCHHKKKNKARGILLLGVFLLLQLALWGPSFLHAFPETEVHASCQGDHALCGCSPSRIASGTCCCALASVSPCCQKNYIQSALKEKTALGTVITSLPCGGSEDPLVTTSIESYLLTSTKMTDPPISVTVYRLVATLNQVEHHILPPVPPPKA